MNPVDDKGLKILPNPMQEEITTSPKVLVVADCYCPHGHSLMFPRARFNGYPGIIVRIKGEDKEGLVCLSPIYGDKSRISLDVDLTDGEVIRICCPYCDIDFPVFAACSCGANLIAIFTTPTPDSENCIGICNRVGCIHAEVKRGGDMVLISLLDELKDP
jgi:hypothetical protein